jgi:hypothetical protein
MGKQLRGGGGFWGYAQKSFEVETVGFGGLNLLEEDNPYGRQKGLYTFNVHYVLSDLPCGLVVRVTGYRSRDPGFDSRSF